MLDPARSMPRVAAPSLDKVPKATSQQPWPEDSACANAGNEAAPNAGASGAGRPGVGAVAATPQAPEAPLSWRLEPSLAQARPWARERPAVAFLHAGVALFHARLAFLEHGRDLAALGVIQAVPDGQPLIAGLLHLGVELTAVLLGLRDQRARVELAAVQLRLEQVMALGAGGAHGVAQTALALGRLDQRLLLVVQFQLFELLLGHGSQAGK